MSFVTGQSVVVAGSLYRGAAVVTDVYDINGRPGRQNRGEVAPRSGQPFPQVGVRATEGRRKKYHFNASDIAAGKVSAASSTPVSRATTPVRPSVAPAPVVPAVETVTAQVNVTRDAQGNVTGIALATSL